MDSLPSYPALVAHPAVSSGRAAAPHRPLGGCMVPGARLQLANLVTTLSALPIANAAPIPGGADTLPLGLLVLPLP